MMYPVPFPFPCSPSPFPCPSPCFPDSFSTSPALHCLLFLLFFVSRCWFQGSRCPSQLAVLACLLRINALCSCHVQAGLFRMFLNSRDLSRCWVHSLLHTAYLLHTSQILPAYLLHTSCIPAAYFLDTCCTVAACLLHTCCTLVACLLHTCCIVPGYLMHNCCLLVA